MMDDFRITDHYIGTIPGESYGYKSRLRVTVSVAVELQYKHRETVTHEMIDEVMQFTLTSSVWNASRTDYIATGPTPEPLRELITDGRPARGLSMDTVRDLLALSRYHLNDMKPGCIHQGKDAGLDGPACPETGYRYGSAWLVEPLPSWLTADYLRNLLGR